MWSHTRATTTERLRDDTQRRAVLYRMVMPGHLCPYGLKAKDLLERNGFEVEDHHLTSRAETDAFQGEHDVETTPQIFVGGRRLGGYDALRVELGLDDDEDDTTYQPIVATFSVTLLLALAISWATLGTPLTVRTAEWFVAFSMAVLAIFKLRDLESFTTRFLGYDLLARRVVRYAYVYPFVEALAAVGMVTADPLIVPIAAAGGLFIGTVGAVSVIKAVYVEGRELQCACVGGEGKVPLGPVSLSENLAMVAMAIWMTAKLAI